MAAPRFPKLGRPRSKDAGLQGWIEQVTTLLEVRDPDTKRGNALDSFISRREAIQTGLFRYRDTVNGSPIEPNPDALPGQLPILTVPPPVTGFSGAGAVQNAVLSWDDPAAVYRNHSFVEVWRAAVDDLGVAVKVASAFGTIYADPIGPGSDLYYWIRAISTSSVAGPFNAVAGTRVQTGIDVSYTIDLLTDEFGGTSEAPFFQIDEATEINGVMVPAGTYMKQAFIHNATISALQVQDAFLDNLTVAKGNLAQARIQKGDIFNLTVGDLIASSNYAAGTTGWRIRKDGTVEFNGGTFRGAVTFTSAPGGVSNIDYAGLGGTKPPADADRTAINTSADTAAVAGTAAATVRDQASAANTRVNDWIRPTTTLINGNKIFTGDAYVDTLQIQGNAVTVPETAGSASINTTLPTNNTFVSITGGFLTVSYSSAAPPGSILVSAILTIRNATANNIVPVELTIIASTGTVSSWVGKSLIFNGASTVEREAQVSFVGEVLNPGGTGCTITLRVRQANGSADVSVRSFGMFALGAKR